MANNKTEAGKPTRVTVVLHLNVLFKDIEYHIEHDTIPCIRRGAKEFITKLHKLNKFFITLCYDDAKYYIKAKEWARKHGIERYISYIKQYETRTAMDINLAFLARYGFNNIYDQLKE